MANSLLLAGLGLAILVVWIMFTIVGGMAERRGQSRILWQVFALAINPLTAMVLLWLLFDVKKYTRL
jgi:carbon starvation protein CstA